jgi:hypothetical protein
MHGRLNDLRTFLIDFKKFLKLPRSIFSRIKLIYLVPGATLVLEEIEVLRINFMVTKPFY